MFIKNFSPALKENNADAFSPYFITSKGCEAVFKFHKRHSEVYKTETTVLPATCRPMGVILSLINKTVGSYWFFCVTSCVTFIVLKNFSGTVKKFYL